MWKTMWKVGKVPHSGERVKPLRPRRLGHLPKIGRLSRGQSPRKKAPHAVGSWPRSWPEGLWLAAFPPPKKAARLYSQAAFFNNSV